MSKYADMQEALYAIKDIKFDDDAPLSIWLGSLAAYNDGALIGRWISLPVDEDALAEAFKIVTEDGDHDFYLGDYQGPLRDLVKSEFTDPIKLNKIVELMEDLDDDEIDVVNWLVGDLGYELDEVLDEEKYRDAYVFSSWGDAVDDYIEIMFSDLDRKVYERIDPYIDEDRVKREMEIGTTTHETEDGRVFVWNW